MRLSRVTLDGDSDNSRKRKFSMSGHDEAWAVDVQMGGEDDCDLAKASEKEEEAKDA
jgi:hypothetical protein